MWTTDQLGSGRWPAEDRTWAVDARGGKTGVHITSTTEASAQPTTLASFGAPGSLPSVAEQFVRGDLWQLNYPQGECEFALRLSFRPIECSADQLILEATVAIETRLLDTHPTIDIEVPCQSVETIQPSSLLTDTRRAASPINLTHHDGFQIAVLLGNHDYPSTTDHSDGAHLRLRLFGEFLEKGVIRKARPWLVIRFGEPGLEPARLEQIWQQLCGSPLPLN